jgi:hypothetical protein
MKKLVVNWADLVVKLTLTKKCVNKLAMKVTLTAMNLVCRKVKNVS